MTNKLSEDKITQRHLELFSEAQALLSNSIEVINAAREHMEAIDYDWMKDSGEFLEWANEHKLSIKKSYDIVQ